MANNTNIQKIKRFHIGKVYRRDQPTINKGRFREFYQCDFDIAGKYDAMVPDAEVLAIMQEILEALTVDEFLVKVNHRKILEAVIREAGCSDELFKPICSSIDKLDKQPWGEVRVELITKGVTEEQVEVIGKLVAFKGEPLKLLD
jgi:histidyl-tRNA synthetase